MAAQTAQLGEEKTKGEYERSSGLTQKGRTSAGPQVLEKPKAVGFGCRKPGLAQDTCNWSGVPRDAAEDPLLEILKSRLDAHGAPSAARREQEGRDPQALSSPPLLLTHLLGDAAGWWAQKAHLALAEQGHRDASPGVQQLYPSPQASASR